MGEDSQYIEFSWEALLFIDNLDDDSEPEYEVSIEV
jgi:hypothetical protein